MSGNDPAYPFLDSMDNDQRTGLTKRELFAAMAMQGLLEKNFVSAERCLSAGKMPDQILAEACIEIADALIAELEKEST